MTKPVAISRSQVTMPTAAGLDSAAGESPAVPVDPLCPGALLGVSMKYPIAGWFVRENPHI